jgi:hypothetical protein
MTGTNFSSWYRADEGTVFVEVDLGGGEFPRAFMISDGTQSNRIFMRRNGDLATKTTDISFSITRSGTSYSLQPSGNSSDTKFATSYAINDIAMVSDGGSITSSNTALLNVVNALYIGGDELATTKANGTIKKLSYYPARLTNAELQGLTS